MITRSTVRGALSGTAFALCALVVPPPPAAAVAQDDPMPPPRPASVSKALLHRPGTHVHRLPGAPALPRDLSALSWLVADVDTGEVLAAHDAHRRLPPASTLKTLFALTALPRLSPMALHTVTGTELASVGEGSSVVGVSPGGTYRIADLWRGVFLSSGNDAVHVLAKMNGGWKATTAQMQAKARALGALDTRVVSPDGYDAPGQVSSAYDLAVFGRTGLADPQFARYAATAATRFPGGTHRDGSPTWTFLIRNTNRLLTGADGVKRYPGIIGLKNGYTTRAGHTLIAAAQRDGRRLLVTVMNPRRGGGHAVYEEARSLLDWGFAAAGRVHPVGSLTPPVLRQAGQATPVSAAQAAALHREKSVSGIAYSWLGALVGAACLTAGVIVWTRGGRRVPARAGRFTAVLGPVRALARRGRSHRSRPRSGPGPQ